MNKILILSDLLFGLYFNETFEFEYLMGIIKKVEPDLIIIAGDILQAGISNKDKLFNYLDKKRILTLCVRGNWDDNSFIEGNKEMYDELFENRKYVKDITNKYFLWNGMKILGIGYSYFNSKENCINIKDNFKEIPDIIISHPPTIKRIWLFELKSKYIILGHDDKRICKVNKTVMICTNWSPRCFGILYIKAKVDKDLITLFDYEPEHFYRSDNDYECIKHTHGKMNSFSLVNYTDSMNFKWLGDKHKYSGSRFYPELDDDYGTMFQVLLQVKKIKKDKNELKLLLKEKMEMYNVKIPKSLIFEYLGLRI